MHICRHLIRVAVILLLVVPCAAEENDPVSVEPTCSVFGLTDDATIPHSVCQITEDYTPFGSSLTSSPDPSIPVELTCEIWPHSYGSVTMLLEGRPTIVAFRLFVVPDPAACRQPEPLITSR